jgi:hypothetical protein
MEVYQQPLSNQSAGSRVGSDLAHVLVGESASTSPGHAPGWLRHVGLSGNPGWRGAVLIEIKETPAGCS